jgi:two-component system chemotaxis sensor kinase CheA
VVIEADELRVPADAFAEFWAVLAHVVRNAVDHGFETAEERAAAGKSPKNRVRLRAFALDERGFVLSLSDDGRGIDWEKVARKAVAAGLPSATQADLEQALYADTISTRDQVSETSGRGVGLGAVRAAVTALGGSIEIESDLGRGTTFRFTLPWPTPERSATAPNQVGTLATARAEPRSATFRLGQARDADGSDEPAMSTLSNSMDGST